MSTPTLLDLLEIETRRANPEHAAAFARARADIAALIEADKEYDAALQALESLNRRIEANGWLDVEFNALREACERLVKARFHRSAALTCCGGAA